MNGLGILAYGSLRTDPGSEIGPLIARRVATQTPFAVEFARLSNTRGGAPTVVPVKSGVSVEAEILLLLDSVSVNAATDMLWRRETRREGTDLKYRGGQGQDAIVVKEWKDLGGVSCVLYTDFNENGKLDPSTLNPDTLAQAAIDSVRRAPPGKDGISYLRDMRSVGVRTALSIDYEASILARTGTKNLADALHAAKGTTMEPASFIGLDLAWRVDSKHSGVAVLSGREDKVRLTAISEGLYSMQGVVEFIAKHATANSVLAVDAPLVVKNKIGQRPCETLISRRFGHCHASCHTTNLRRPHARTGTLLVSALEAYGFRPDFALSGAKHRPGRWLFEVYPHPAMVQLFELDQIIRYKKGPVAEKRLGLRALQHHLLELEGIEKTTDLNRFLRQDPESLRGERLKRYEDTLDAVFCAYLAWHCWKWGEDRNEMFGTLEDGYIVVAKGA